MRLDKIEIGLPANRFKWPEKTKLQHSKQALLLKIL